MQDLVRNDEQDSSFFFLRARDRATGATERTLNRHRLKKSAPHEKKVNEIFQKVDAIF